MDRFVVISGCSGGGKSTLIAELARGGQVVVAEPGRRIVAEERAGSGRALPWIDPVAFARRAIAMADADRIAAATQPGWVFFDRGLVDAAAALEHATGTPAIQQFAAARYHRRVFMAPPWRGLYRTDGDRRQGWTDAVAEYERLLVAYRALDYEVVSLPMLPVAGRAAWLLAQLGAGPTPPTR